MFILSKFLIFLAFNMNNSFGELQIDIKYFIEIILIIIPMLDYKPYSN